MQKIMFNDKFGLTQAVLEGSKTITRRIIDSKTSSGANDYVQRIHGTGLDFLDYLLEHSRYNAGEVVAVAQAYQDVRNGRGYPIDSRYDHFRTADWGDGRNGSLKATAGEKNKRFVSAELMPHQIRITSVYILRLQDISDEDCLEEGIYKQDPRPGVPALYAFETCKDQDGDTLAKRWFSSPREAFAALIDKVSGKGTWDSNPWVYVYEFEKVK